MEYLAEDPAARDRLAGALEGLPVRVLWRDTYLYSRLLWGLMADRSIAGRAEARAYLARLADLPCRNGSTPTADLVRVEVESLLAGDVPLFTRTCRADRLDLPAGTPAQAEAMRLRHAVGAAYLRVPVARVAPAQAPGATAVATAARAALQSLADRAVRFPDGSVGWCGTRWDPGSREFVTAPLGWGLHEGHLGVVVGLTVGLRAGIFTGDVLGQASALAEAAVARIADLAEADRARPCRLRTGWPASASRWTPWPRTGRCSPRRPSGTPSTWPRRCPVRRRGAADRWTSSTACRHPAGAHATGRRSATV